MSPMTTGDHLLRAVAVLRTRIADLEAALAAARETIEGLSPWSVKAAELSNERDRAVGVLRKLQIIGATGDYLCETPLDFLKRLDATCDALTAVKAERDRWRDYVAGLPCEHQKVRRVSPGLFENVDCGSCDTCQARAAKEGR